ncbi:MAG TPA: two-component regulator propeller domain-containing protein, partial [Niabella sp.]
MWPLTGSINNYQTIINKTVLLLVACVCLLTTAFAQPLRLFKSFSIDDGLPSNLIYSCTQDEKGFLWIATDNGVSRFDGKYFRNYSLTDGVPDNDVLEVVKEKNGTIWINTFKQGPCYYDEKTDRFIDPLKNSTVQRGFVKLV